MTALELKEVTKTYGRLKALDNLSLTIPKGVVCGFIGANGAGKTTTFSSIAGFVNIKRGQILIGGEPLSGYLRAGRQIGVLPQDMLFFETRSIYRQLLLFAKLAGFGGAAARDEVMRVLSLVSLSEKAKVYPSGLSRGMRVRLGVAQALIGSPEIILLDEPLAGLDPRMKKSIKDLILDLKTKTTLVISSHELSELDQLCDYFCIIDKGSLVKEGFRSDILADKATVTYKVLIEEEDYNSLKSEFSSLIISRVSSNVIQVEFQKDTYSLTDINSKILSWLLEREVKVCEVLSHEKLEDIYLSVTNYE